MEGSKQEREKGGEEESIVYITMFQLPHPSLEYLPIAKKQNRGGGLVTSPPPAHPTVCSYL